MDEIAIRVNGAARSVKRGTTVAALLVELSAQAGRVAVERNHDVVPRSEYERTLLAAGDQLEVVGFVGGG